MSTISNGSSTEMASEMVSLLSATPGPARGGDAEVSGERRAEGHADRGDLVFGLHRADTEVLVLRQLVEDVARRRDRVRPERDGQRGELSGGDDAPGRARCCPVMLVYSPAGRRAGRTSNRCPTASVVSPKLNPARNDARLAAWTCSFLAKRVWIHSSVSSVGRVNIHETRPRAKKFFERSASRGFTPSGMQTSLVRLVIGTRSTR